MKSDIPNPVSSFVFDRRVHRQHRSRARHRFGDHDFLFRLSADQLVERLYDIKRQYATVLDLGCRDSSITTALASHTHFGIKTLIQASAVPISSLASVKLNLICDEESLPFHETVFDLVLSNLSLHWVNDLPGSLIQIRQSLRPDGLFCASLFGAGTLSELREVLLEAEIAVTGGASPRVSPFAEVRELGGLLQRAGFALPVVDVDKITVTYANIFKLMSDLRGMGETNALLNRQKLFTRRSIFLKAAALYTERYGDQSGRIPASFQIITMTAWSPHADQPKPLRPGSATTSLTKILRDRGR